MVEIAVQVNCCAGFHGEPEPERFLFGPRAILVSEILDRWLGHDHRYFKLLGSDGHTYILRHEVERRAWTLAYYRRASPTQDSGSAHPGISAMTAEANA